MKKIQLVFYCVGAFRKAWQRSSSSFGTKEKDERGVKGLFLRDETWNCYDYERVIWQKHRRGDPITSCVAVDSLPCLLYFHQQCWGNHHGAKIMKKGNKRLKTTEASQERQVLALKSCNLFHFGSKATICSTSLKQMQNNKWIISQEWLTHVRLCTIKLDLKHKLILNVHWWYKT